MPDTPDVNILEERYSRRRWFPLIWTVLVVGLCLALQISSADQDIKNTSVLLGAGALLLGLTTWVLARSKWPMRKRLLWGLGPWVVAFLFHSQVELINNGDIGLVGWRWRWAATPDERLAKPATSAEPIADWKATPHDYPAFLGGHLWAEVENVKLATDWQTHPPLEKWRCQVGAGWSSFAIVGNYAITQEQRGEQEMVVCYRIETAKPDGEIVWTHADPVRFDPNGSGALGGVGPRATPRVYQDRVLTMGATGILNCLDARTGRLLWSHDTLAEHNIENIMWGKSCSPVVLENEGSPPLVLASVGAPDASLVAYDLDTGKEAWAAGSRRSAYATPVVTELLGERQVLCVNEDFVTSHSARDGKVLWEHEWPGNSDMDASVSQPIPLPGDRVFLSKGYQGGASLVQLARDDSGTIVIQPLWEPPVKRVMKTKMSNVVIRDGYVYGLDNGILQCIDLERGHGQWKKRRVPAVGHGQIMLVDDALLILSESGELILVAATPEEYRELASLRVFPEDQVTWNNPAFSAPYLLLRNSEQAVCLEMPVEADSEPIAR